MPSLLHQDSEILKAGAQEGKVGGLQAGGVLQQLAPFCQDYKDHLEGGAVSQCSLCPPRTTVFTQNAGRECVCVKGLQYGSPLGLRKRDPRDPPIIQVEIPTGGKKTRGSDVSLGGFFKELILKMIYKFSFKLI